MTERVIGCALAVHKMLGPGLLESVYQGAMVMELRHHGLVLAQQVPVPVIYRGQDLGIGFRADMVVADSLLLEFKSVEQVTKVHVAQVINYLKLLKIKRGLLINFNTSLLKHGIKRISI